MRTKEQKYEYNRNWRKLNAERVREISRKSYYRRKIKGFTPEQIERRKRNYRKWRSSPQGREYMRKYSVFYYYGISWEDKQFLLEIQKNRCAVCKRKFNKDSKNLFPHVDHNHNTKKVRGLLCRNCNSAIGFLRESSKLCIRAAEYLKMSELM